MMGAVMKRPQMIAPPSLLITIEGAVLMLPIPVLVATHSQAPEPDIFTTKEAPDVFSGVNVVEPKTIEPAWKKLEIIAPPSPVFTIFGAVAE